jgi:hypothetical protein
MCRYVEYAFSFKCGNQPVTGELVVQKGLLLVGSVLFLMRLGGSELLKVEFKRAHRNEFKGTRKYV